MPFRPRRVRASPRRCERPARARDGRGAARWRVAPLRYGVRMLQQVLVGQVGDLDRRFAGQPVVRRSIATRGSSNSGRMVRPCWSIGSRTMLTSARPSCSTSTWSSQVVRSSSIVEPGMLGGERPHRRGDGDAGHETDRERLRSAGRSDHPAPRRFRRREQRPRVLEQLAPGRGQLGGPLGPHEQLDACSSSSRARICRDNTGWAMCSRSAARPKCNSSATATKYRTFRRSTSTPPPDTPRV